MNDQTVIIDVTKIPDHVRDVLAADTLAMILRWKAREKEKAKEESGK